MGIFYEIKTRGIRVAQTAHKNLDNVEQIVFILDNTNGEKTRGYDAKTTLFIVCRNGIVKSWKIAGTTEYLISQGIDYKLERFNNRILITK